MCKIRLIKVILHPALLLHTQTDTHTLLWMNKIILTGQHSHIQTHLKVFEHAVLSFQQCPFFLLLEVSRIGLIRANQGHLPIYHGKKQPFQPVSSSVPHKRWNVIESNFLPPQNTHFHTTHQVKLCPKSLNRNLKAILFLEMETAWNITISLDCTLAGSLNTMSH